jgi:hypothetical protein
LPLPGNLYQISIAVDMGQTVFKMGDRGKALTSVDGVNFAGLLRRLMTLDPALLERMSGFMMNLRFANEDMATHFPHMLFKENRLAKIVCLVSAN